MTDCCGNLGSRHVLALKSLAMDRINYLILGEFPRGIGYGILAELMRRGLVEMGISERFRGKAGWRITACGLECEARKGLDTPP